MLFSCQLNVTGWFTSNISKLSCTYWYDDDNGNDDTGDEKGDDDGDDDVEDDDNGFDWTEILDNVIVCILVYSPFIIVVFIKAIIAIMVGFNIHMLMQ